MNGQRWVVVAVACGALSATNAAPVPKAKPHEGTIVMMSGYGGAPRLFRTDGTIFGALPFKSVRALALSPDGTRAAVVVSTRAPNAELVVVRVGADSDDIGKPLATVGRYSSVAWGANGKLYLSALLEPPAEGRRAGTMFLPGGVTIHDLERGTATEDKALANDTIIDVSSDGKRLLAQRFVAEPKPRWEYVLLDTATHKPLNVEVGDLQNLRFYGPEGLVGTRSIKGAQNDVECVVFDLTAKRAVPLKSPEDITASKGRVIHVLPSPDRDRLLYVCGANKCRHRQSGPRARARFARRA